MSTVRQLEYYAIAQETVWGDGAAAGPWTGIPPDDYGVDLENSLQKQDKFTGEIDDVYVDLTAQDLKGGAKFQIWPDNAALLLTMAGVPRVNDDVPSFAMRCYDRAKGEYIVHSGLKCNKVDFGCGGRDLKLTGNYDLIGKKEDPITSFAKPIIPAQSSFEFSDATFTIGGVVEPNIIDFKITINNNLKPSEPRDANRNVRWIDPGKREVEVTFTIRTDVTMANHYRNMVRSRAAVTSFSVLFDYPGTGTPIDKITFTVGSLMLTQATRKGGTSDQQSIDVQGTAKKPGGMDAIVITTS
jgi:hypothetical protein